MSRFLYYVLSPYFLYKISSIILADKLVGDVLNIVQNEIPFNQVKGDFVLFYISFISCDNYAVLVAGSNTYINYRHQADVFHHYQILIDRGFMPENIITFAYDDIAYNPKNPLEGKIYNSPNGKDVYSGVIIDYIENDVTPENFIAAITGDEMSVNVNDPRSTAKVLTSTNGNFSNPQNGDIITVRFDAADAGPTQTTTFNIDGSLTACNTPNKIPETIINTTSFFINLLIIPLNITSSTIGA